VIGKRKSEYDKRKNTQQNRKVDITLLQYRLIVQQMSLSEDIKKALKESYKDSFKKRRCRTDIIVDILSIARGKAKKTQIVYKADLNFRMLEEYLPQLVDKGLIENTDGEYETTEKGERFLTDYQKMKEMLR
jgi:predicted transcriptional regulator